MPKRNKPTKDPQRTCIGCHAKKTQAELIRLKLDKNTISLAQSGGRGAYLCSLNGHIKPSCYDQAKEEKNFQKAFKTSLKIKSLKDFAA